jgi:DNA repair exonuclease SbcCD ATPase subunit
MNPLKLSVKNFMTYREADIDFSKFDSALVLGQHNGDLSLSNAAGKSTIFRAIKYALFGTYDVSTIDRIVRRGEKKCIVEFEFEIDSIQYKIFRARTKGSSTLEFYQKINDQWVSKSSNTNSNIESEISKLLSLNDNAFHNIYLFSQKDHLHGFLSAKNPKERIEIIKNALLLSIYSRLEQAAKEKISEINKEITILNAKIESLENPIEHKEEVIKKLQITQSILDSKISDKHNILEKLNSLNQELNILESSLDKSVEDMLKQVKQFQSESETVKTKLSSSEDKKSRKFNEKQKSLKDSQELINLINKYNLELKSYLDLSSFDKNELKEELQSLFKEESDLKAKVISNNTRLNQLKNPLPEDEVCSECFQTITEEYKNCHLEKVSKELQILNEENKQYNLKLEKIQNKKNDANNKIAKTDERSKLINETEQKIKNLKEKESSCAQNRESIEEFISLIDKEIQSFNETLNSLQEKISLLNDKISKNINKDVSEKIKNIKEKINIANEQITALNGSILTGTNNLAILKDKIELADKNILKFNAFISSKKSLEDSLNDYQVIAQGFSPTGTPNRIIYNILDLFQSNTNIWLSKIKPGLEIQFIITKDKKGKEEDTFDIKFFENSLELDASELSGGQEFVIRWALKMGLKDTVENGVPKFKLLCFDEIDERLDEASSSAFISIIKELEKDYKVLVITHKDKLKEKFNNAIIVNNEGQLGSIAKVISV